jgi:hypothetical protein
VASATVWAEIHAVSKRICRRFGLRWPLVFEPLVGTVKCRDYRTQTFGECVRKEGCTPEIRLRVHVAGKPRRALRRSTIFAILAHELAHLHDRSMRHDERHAQLTREIAAWLKAEGYPVASNALCLPPLRRRAS